MLIAVETRMNEDDRTGGEIFFLLCDEPQDICFQRSMALILQTVIEVSVEKYCMTVEKAAVLMTDIISRLPSCLREMLTVS